MENGVCSFTGHRVIAREHDGKIEELLARAVAYAYDEGVRSFLGGGAIGFDTIAAKAVIKFRLTHPDVRLVLLLPCKNQSLKWNDYERSVYEYTLSVADELEYLAEEYYDGCMKERNVHLAERCDMLVAYVSKKNSGSAQTLRMAERLGKRVYNLFPALSKS